jgi:hypothetical protein
MGILRACTVDLEGKEEEREREREREGGEREKRKFVTSARTRHLVSSSTPSLEDRQTSRRGN